MQTIFLGDYMKARRIELGLTQEELCEGICEPVTISRMENGRQTPSRSRINALLQRLGLPDDRYFALLSQNEVKIDELQKEITSCNIRRDTKRGLKKLHELEELLDPDDHVTRQFVLRVRASLGWIDGDTVRPYTPTEQLDMLMDAIQLTAPNFALDEIERHLYSLDEIKVINAIAVLLCGCGQHDRAIRIYDQLLRYIRRHNANILQSGGLLPFVAYNYARVLDADRQYEAALELAELGRQACVQYGTYQCLPAILSVMAECYHFVGRDSDSEKLYLQAYYTAQSMEDTDVIAVARREMKQYLGIEPLH